MSATGPSAELPRATRADGLLWCALGLALGPAVALGLARFAYSLVLPAMRADLDWTYGQAGLMNTANALGYLAGAVVTTAVGRRFGSRRTFVAGMLASGLALLAAAGTADFAGQLGLRLVAGIGAALTFITGAALTATLAQRAPERAGLLLGLYTAGAGAGVVLSGVTVQPLLGAVGPEGWRWSWVILAGLAGACVLGCLPAVRRTPEPARTTRRGDPVPVRRLALPGAAYFLFGAGYIAYVTFVVAYLRAEGFGSGAVTVFWVLLGLAAIAGVPTWGRVLERMRSGHALALMNAVLVVGALLVLLIPGPAAGFGSAVLFGAAFLAVPAGSAHLVRRHLPPATWAAAIGGLTIAFAVGQSVGPALAGLLAERAGGSAIGLAIAAGTLAAAVVVNLAAEVRRPGPATP